MMTYGSTSTRDASEDVLRALDPLVVGPELLALATSREPQVRAAVASRSDCPAGALISLGHDHQMVVLEAVIANPKTPSSVIRNLGDHRNQRVADLAVQRLRNSFR
ncbi:hypothetical protein [Demequina aurantiaca]|uniref:hypothetical protein n=1 Tax=Demequina aurantiaca TaxID=676200 RepID=UPI0007859A2F|nr:hypothetical protein [Demequina aurantiaca]